MESDAIKIFVKWFENGFDKLFYKDLIKVFVKGIWKRDLENVFGKKNWKRDLERVFGKGVGKRIWKDIYEWFEKNLVKDFQGRVDLRFERTWRLWKWDFEGRRFKLIWLEKDI